MTVKHPSIVINLMDLPITQEEIDAVKVRAKAATDGLWLHRKDGQPDFNNERNMIEAITPASIGQDDESASLIAYGQLSHEDASYIVAAQPLLVLRLIASYEALQKRLERATRALERSGFQDLGGQEWKPPIGKPPTFIPVTEVPEGFRLVPKPYTDEQLAEGVKHLVEVRSRLGEFLSDETICGVIYDGMVHAADLTPPDCKVTP